MRKIASVGVATFTIACMLGTFSISWMVLGAIGVPGTGAFWLSLFYSLIPVIVWIMEEDVDSMEELNANRIAPVLDDYTASHIAASCKPSKRPRKRAAQADDVQPSSIT